MSHKTDTPNLDHGNRLHDPITAYEKKKQRSKDTYAKKCLQLDPYWRNEKLLREYYFKYGWQYEIGQFELFHKGFDLRLYTAIFIAGEEKVFAMHKFGFSYFKNKNIKAWKM